MTTCTMKEKTEHKDLIGRVKTMKVVVTLTPSESKRLIAKAVVKMPEVQKAWENAYLLLADGTTNAFVQQELLQDKSISPETSAIGISTNGLLCVTRPATRNYSENYRTSYFERNYADYTSGVGKTDSICASSCKSFGRCQ